MHIFSVKNLLKQFLVHYAFEQQISLKLANFFKLKWVPKDQVKQRKTSLKPTLRHSVLERRNKNKAACRTPKSPLRQNKKQKNQAKTFPARKHAAKILQNTNNKQTKHPDTMKDLQSQGGGKDKPGTIWIS